MSQQIVPTRILGRKPNGNCEISGKKDVEVFICRIGNGEPRCIAAKSLIDTLRLTCSIVVAAPESPRPVKVEADA